MSDKNGNLDMGSSDISNVLNELKKSYNSDIQETSEIEDTTSMGNVNMSEDELKDKLRAQFMQKADISAELVGDEDAYRIDEDFLSEAEVIEEEPIAVEEEEIQEAVEIPNEDIAEADTEESFEVTFDDIQDNAAAVIELEAIEENSFDESKLDIAEAEAELFESEYDEDMTFDDIEDLGDDEYAPSLTRLELDDDSEREYEEYTELVAGAASTEQDTAPTFYRTIADSKQELERKVINRQINEEKAREELEENTAIENIPLEEAEAQRESKEDFLDELIEADSKARKDIDSAELALLMQFGCEDEVLDNLQNNTAQPEPHEEYKESVHNDIQNTKTVEDVQKLKAYYGELKAKRRKLLINILISAIPALLLFVYELLTSVGVQMPGIMNREDFFVPYLILSLQLTVFCAITSLKKLWDGAKRLASMTPNSYTVAAILAVVVVLYDIVAIIRSSDTLSPTFHFVWVAILILANFREVFVLSTNIKQAEFFFSSAIFGDNGNKSKFTLTKSRGRKSTAEKMYSGGLDASKNIYSPIATNRSLNINKCRMNGNELSMLTIIISACVSIMLGVVGGVIASSVAVAFMTILISMFLTMPIMSMATKNMPFMSLTAKAKDSGYAFTNEAALEKYSDADIFIFKDLHIFAEVPASGVNIALYDATGKDVLIGCLDSVYSTVGGPLGSAFSGGRNQRFKKCVISRIGKNGIEAFVGDHYSVLVGNEQFMSRYGISFPNIVIGKKTDEIFTLCISINGRATARIAVRYTVNDMFRMFADRLYEDGIFCAVETFDPLISTELLSNIQDPLNVPVSVVHLNAEDLRDRANNDREQLIFDAEGGEAEIVAYTSRLNLAVALCAAKRTHRLNRILQLVQLSALFIGVCLATLISVFKLGDFINEFYIVLYWLLTIVGTGLFTLKSLPSENRFSLNDYMDEYYGVEDIALDYDTEKQK